MLTCICVRFSTERVSSSRLTIRSQLPVMVAEPSHVLPVCKLETEKSRDVVVIYLLRLVSPWNSSQTGTGEMMQSGKCLPHKLEALMICNPSAHMKK